MNLKEYLLSLRNFLLFSFLFFLCSILLGCFGAKIFPYRTLWILTALKAVCGEVATWKSFEQFLFVIFNNSFLLLLILFFSFFFGIFPILVLLSNGVVLGGLVFFLKGSLPISLFLLSTLPHGIFEIPVLIIACSVGLKIAKRTIGIVLGKERGLRKEIFEGLKFFLIILFPCLVLAALIEVYFIPYFLNRLII